MTDDTRPLTPIVAQHVASGGQAFNVQSGGNTDIIQSSGTYNFGGARIEGGVHIAARTAPEPVPLPAALAHLQTMPLDTLPAPAPLPQPYRMPLSRNPRFVGRQHDLMRLARSLKGGTTAAIGQVEVAAATGMGGVGKTQLAAEFVHRYGQYFQGGVFWLSFATAAGVPAEVAACGGRACMDLPAIADLPLDEQVALVQRAWGDPLPRLLVFDNCEDEALLATWRPTSGGACVLVTSRRTQWQQVPDVEIVPLGVLQRQESLALLHHFRPDLARDDPGLAAVAAELGDLPLALHLAGSYLARYQQRVSPQQYLAHLRAAPILSHRSLQATGLSPTQHVQDVRRTFALSYDALDAADPSDAVARALLARAAAFASGEPLPRDLLILTLELDDDDLDAELLAEDALARLLDLGLLEAESAAALRVHRLVAAFVQTMQPDPEAQSAVERVMVTVASYFNREGVPAPLLELQVHLRAVARTAWQRADELAADVCNVFGYHLNMIGNYAEARQTFERALTICEQVVGPKHPNTAMCLNNLGMMLYTQGEYAGARPYYERAVAICEQELGPRHPMTATCLNNMGMLLHSRGEYAEARPYFERALAIQEEILGPAHPDTARSLNNLGALLQATGDYAEARPYYERALALYEQELGAAHPDTARSLNNLGYLLQAMGQYAEAHLMFGRALAIYEQVLGPTHPNTAMVLNNLGMMLYTQGEYAQARPNYERALAIHEQMLGPEHPMTAMSLNNLGLLLYTQGEYAEAQPYYERAVAIYEKALGSEHHDTAMSLNNLGMLLQATGDYSEARPYLERALVIQEQLGPAHPDTARSLNNMGYLLQLAGDDAAARPYFERALAINEAVLGADHPDTAMSLNNLAVVLQSQRDYAEARPYYERALAIYEEILGRTHTTTATSLNNLAGLLQAQGDYAGARPYYQRAIAINEAALGADHPTTHIVRDNLSILDHVARIHDRAREAVANALQGGAAAERAALAQQLETEAQGAASGQSTGAPDPTLAAYLRHLRTQLHAVPPEGTS